MTENDKAERKRGSKRGWIIFLSILGLIIFAVVLALVVRVQGYAKGYGNVTARKDPLLRASQKGPIGQILVQQDQIVSKGQLIIQLDENLAKAALARYEKALAEAGGTIKVFQARCNLAAAQREYQQARSALQIKAAKHKLDQLLAGREKGTVSPIELAEAQLSYEMTALEPYQSYKAQEQLEEQELALLKQQLEAASAQVGLSKQQLVRLQVLSPIDGRVVLNPLVAGEVVDTNKVLGRVFDESSFTIQARFPERLLYFVKQGQKADIWPTGRSRWAEPLNGKVIELGQLIQPQDTGDGYFWVSLSIESRGLRLYPGQNVRVAVSVAKVSIFRSIIGL